MAGGVRIIVDRLAPVAALVAVLPAKSAHGQATTSVPSQGPKPPRPRRERDLIESGFVLLGLVMLLCFVLIIVVITVGRRTRRIAGGALPGATPLDPLWFLKGNKSGKPGKQQPTGGAGPAGTDSD